MGDRSGVNVRLRRHVALSRREWLTLGACLLVVGATLGSFLILSSYEESHRAGASEAAAAQLDASRLNAFEWQTIAQGRLLAGSAARVDGLLGSIGGHLDRLPEGGGTPRQALGAYAAAIREEFRLLGAGRIEEARLVDEERVDPAFGELGTSLEHVASTNAAAARKAENVAKIGGSVVAVLGFTIVALLLLRFAAARRALFAAGFEEQLLRESDKAKSELISVVSHDLRTPLTSIVGYLEVIRDGEAGPLTAEQERFLAIVKRNADRLLTLANDLLFISRAEAGRIDLNFEELTLDRVAADAVENQRPDAVAHRVGLQLESSLSAPIMADRRRLDELIANLVSNAVKFTPAGGSVAVAVTSGEGCVRLEVSDTGVGIPLDQQEHLFERFYRSPDASGTPGAGLGLAIVKAIADAHDARITVRSRLGEGTTFRVEFPCLGGWDAPARPSAAPDESERAPS